MDLADIKETGRSGIDSVELTRRVKLREVEDLAGMDLAGAELNQANLSGMNLFDANLSGAQLVGADLSGCDLTGADLSHADLTRANLSAARLWHANLKGAKLVEADLKDADLWQARLCNVRLWRTQLSGAHSITRASFRSKNKGFFPECAAYEEGAVSAEETYRNLKRYFMSEGRYNDASWASFKEKEMEKISLRNERRLEFIPAAIMGFLCGYGEKPQRIIVSSLFVILFYAAIYNIFRTAASGIGDTALSFWDHLYFSVITFTTVGFGDIVPRSYAAYRLLSASEAFLGAFLMGLFVFTLARKYSAR